MQLRYCCSFFANRIRALLGVGVGGGCIAFAYSLTRLCGYTNKLTTTKLFANRIRHVCDKIYVNQQRNHARFKRIIHYHEPKLLG